MKDFKSFSGKQAKDAEQIVKENLGRKEEDLFSDLYRRAEEGKKNGTLTNEQIDAFCRKVAPMLDAAQRRKLQAIAERLKRI